MSTVSRIISGSAASWAKMGVNIGAQLVLVPIYLTHWDTETFGIWIGIQAAVSILTMLDFGHQTFLEFEFLKIGRNKSLELSSNLSAGIFTSICLSVIQIGIICIIVSTNTVHILFGEVSISNKKSIDAAGALLLLYGFNWLFNISISGLLNRALAPFGYYSRMAWWNLTNTIISTITPIIAVTFGAELLETGIITVSSIFVGTIPQYIDMVIIMRKENLKLKTPSYQLAYKNFILSLTISGKLLLENTRQQGVRLIMSPMLGSSQLAAFSTMRTGANVALQSLNTIANPLLPELMRFIHQRNQAKSEGALGTVWFMVVAFLTPTVVILQAIIEPLYTLWTREQIKFDSLLFLMLSTTVLVYALAQPAIAITRGNNLLKVQLKISIVSALIVVTGMLILVPMIGMRGAGMVLIIAEIYASISYKTAAKTWLESNGLYWPKRLFKITVNSVLVSVISMIILVLMPKISWYIISVSLIVLFVNSFRYWKSIPTEVVKNIDGIKLSLFEKKKHLVIK